MKKILLSILFVLASVSAFAKSPKINSTPAFAWSIAIRNGSVFYFNPSSSTTQTNLILNVSTFINVGNTIPDNIVFFCNTNSGILITPGNSATCQINPGQNAHWVLQKFINGSQGVYYILDK